MDHRGPPTEAGDRAGCTLRDEVEGVAQMKTGNGTAGALQFMLARAREHDDRPVIPILETRRDDADHALMPLGAIRTQRVGIHIAGRGGFLDLGERLFLHRCLDVATVAVQAVELARHWLCFGGAFGKEAADAERHVGEASGGVESRPGDKSEIARGRPARVTASDREQRRADCAHQEQVHYRESEGAGKPGRREAQRKGYQRRHHVGKKHGEDEQQKRAAGQGEQTDDAEDEENGQREWG